MTLTDARTNLLNQSLDVMREIDQIATAASKETLAVRVERLLESACSPRHCCGFRCPCRNPKLNEFYWCTGKDPLQPFHHYGHDSVNHHDRKIRYYNSESVYVYDEYGFLMSFYNIYYKDFQAMWEDSWEETFFTVGIDTPMPVNINLITTLWVRILNCMLTDPWTDLAHEQSSPMTLERILDKARDLYVPNVERNLYGAMLDGWELRGPPEEDSSS